MIMPRDPSLHDLEPANQGLY